MRTASALLALWVKTEIFRYLFSSGLTEMRGVGDFGWRYSVGAHETFPFRYGWLKKGFDVVRQSGFALSDEEAMVVLGVGKNMVRSIRFWCLATQIAEEEPCRTGRKPLRPTLIGEKLLSDDGWDPYLEDLASLWLLHWLLVTNPVRASAWYYIFTGYPEEEFTKKRLVIFLQGIANQQHAVSPKSIERDVDCFLRTYVPAFHSLHILPEAALECPLAELGIIRGGEEEGTYRFYIGQKDGLPPHIIGFALVQFWNAYASRRRTLSLRECLYAPGSPGQAFRLNEDSLLVALEELQKLTKGKIDIGETAGVTQVHFKPECAEELSGMAFELLQDYYARERSHGR